ncbi:MAG: MFS transporter [Bacteroidetes bacterium]|nr:MFS transporter [Bacteroidota bacterium]MDA1122056.1 MFS transporter [Bacteroidota bacterium]
MNQKKVINAWCMYDWANSVYSLTITTAIFPIYYEAVTKEAFGSDIVSFFGFQLPNTVLYSYALSCSFLIVAAILPLLTGIADYGGRKKSFLKFFASLGSFSCIMLFFFDGPNIEFGIACAVFASVGYSGSLVFYDAFLPEIVSQERYDVVSAKGYSFGYFGSVILLLINLAMIQMPEAFGIPPGTTAAKISFLMVGLWWIGFAQIPFRILPDQVRNRIDSSILINGYQEIRKVWLSLKDSPHLKKYLTSFFFYTMGVQTVMYMAPLYGTKVLQLTTDKLIITVLLIQLVAIPGSYGFAKLSQRKGNKFALMVMLVIWIFVCYFAYTVTKEIEFYVLATVVGLIMGGIQALSRATYSKLIPKSTIDTASYFSFFDVTYNLGVVCGTFAYGLIEHITGSMRNSTIALAVFFILGIVFLSMVKSPLLNPSQRQS